MRSPTWAVVLTTVFLLYLGHGIIVDSATPVFSQHVVAIKQLAAESESAKTVIYPP